jgi:phosphoribosylanthranilate isomerase
MQQPTEPFIIKICGITTADDAKAALEAGANALGFNFWPKSKRYIPVGKAAEIASTLSMRYLWVGVFVNPTEEELLHAAAAVPLDVLQLHGRTARIPREGYYRIWRALPAGSKIVPDQRVEAYLFDTPSLEYGGSGQTFDWTLAARTGQRTLIAGGLEPGNVAEAIRVTCPWGVDACSRIEESPGRKHHGRMQSFVNEALAAWETLAPAR